MISLVLSLGVEGEGSQGFGMAMKHQIIWKAIVKDIASGLTHQELTRKYSLSGAQLRSVLKQLAKLRDRRIQTLVDDLRSGMARSELMKKYHLSTEGFARTLKLLGEAKAISPYELEAFRSFSDGQGTPELREHSVGKKTIKAKELLADIKAGLDDEGLMKKYGFSRGRILKVMNRLIWQGLMTPSELAERRSLAKTVYMPVFECRSCGHVQFEEMEKCPGCGKRMRPSRGEKSDFSF